MHWLLVQWNVSQSNTLFFCIRYPVSLISNIEVSHFFSVWLCFVSSFFLSAWTENCKKCSCVSLSTIGNLYNKLFEGYSGLFFNSDRTLQPKDFLLPVHELFESNFWLYFIKLYVIQPNFFASSDEIYLCLRLKVKKPQFYDFFPMLTVFFVLICLLLVMGMILMKPNTALTHWWPLIGAFFVILLSKWT